MGWMQRLWTAARIGAKADPLWPAGPANPRWWAPQAGYVPLSGVGNGGGNSAVVAVLQVLATTFPEAPPRVVVEGEGDVVEETLGHPATQLLRTPNPYMTWGLLAAYKVWAEHLAGDAYFMVTRNASGEPIALWPLLPSLVTPKGNTDQLITHYDYTPRGTPVRLEPIEDIIHLRSLGLDPEDFRHGLAPIKTVLREVLGDEAAGQFAAALLKNMAVPGVIISPKGESDLISEPSATRMKETFTQKFGGSRRGEPYISSGAVDVRVVSWSPEQLNFKDLRRVPEERISAVTGVPAILAGLGAGLDRAINANARELRESYTETKLVPYWRETADQLTIQFLRPNYLPGPLERMDFNTSKVRALQEDRDALVKRWETAVDGGISMISEARRAIDLDVLPEHDVFLIPAGRVAVTAASLAADAALDLTPEEETPSPLEDPPTIEEQQDTE